MPVSRSDLISSVTVRIAVDNLTRLRALGRQVIHGYKLLAVLVLNVLICLVALELASTAVVKVRRAVKGPEETLDPREASSYYTSQNWAPVYWHEFHASRRQKYHPYVLWRRAAFSGKTINIDENGVRSTPGAVCSPTSYKVFMLGGSTVWGTGAPDWGTLPAYLQSKLQRGHLGPVCVVNFGESAYVSTQSLLQLLLELRHGNLPNLVISYEGPNDAYSAYQSGKAGVHENLDQLVAAFEGGKTAEQSAVGQLMRRMSVFSLTGDLVEKVTRNEEEPVKPGKFLTYQTLGIDQESLTASVVNTFLGNYDVVDTLSRKYGFDFRFIWPPHISMGKKPLIPEERSLAEQVDPALTSLYHSVYRAIVAAQPRYPRLADITDVFDRRAELVWIDDMHVTPDGNQVLAARIAGLVSDSHAPPSDEEGGK
jgi:lysophospholipase L1-like esterase